MSVEYKIICDMCKSTNVIDYVEPDRVQYEEVSMQEYIKKRTNLISLGVYYFTHHKLVCTDCGHIERYHV